MSRTARRNMATVKPTTPLHAPNKGPLKPPSPLHPKNAPKTPISHPQRRWRFQSHTGTSEQRRRWFQTTGPPGRPRIGPPIRTRALKLCPAPPFHTWPLSPAPGPSHPHVGPMTCTRAAPPRRMLRGLRAYQGVNAHVQWLTCEQLAEIDTESAKVQTH